MRTQGTHRVLLLNVCTAGVVAVGTAAGVALAGGSGGATAVKATPSVQARAANPIVSGARHALAGLVAHGTIDQSQADAILRQVEAGSIDPKAVVASGLLTDAQMRSVAGALDQVKRSASAG